MEHRLGTRCIYFITVSCVECYNATHPLRIFRAALTRAEWQRYSSCARTSVEFAKFGHVVTRRANELQS